MHMEGKLLLKEGQHQAETLSGVEFRNLPPIQKVQMTEKLSALSDDFVFFTHALLFTEAKMQYDPLEELMLKKDNYDMVFSVQYNKPLFNGLVFPDGSSWNRILLGCKKEHWLDVYTLLNTMVAVSSVDSKLYSCFMSQAFMPDPNQWDGSTTDIKVNPKRWGELCEMSARGLAGDSRYVDVMFPDKPSSIKIFVSGVSGPKRLAYIKSGLRPYVVYSEPEQQTIDMQGVVNDHAV